MNKKQKLFAGFLVLFLIVTTNTSCQQAETGEWRLAPVWGEKIESGAEAATGALGLLSLFVPGLAGVAGIAAGATGAFKKMKPNLMKYKNTSKHIVTAVEKVKKNQPELWAKIKSEFKDGTDADIDAVINQIVAMAKAQEKAS